MRHGFLLVDKSSGPTSHDVVQAVRKTLGERSIGHLGTLDPAATGLLVLAIGKKALKIVELFNHLPKEYEAIVRFGAVSTTYDATGTIHEHEVKKGWSIPDASIVQRTIQERFIGRISQVPPAFSAVHTSGVRSYVQARKGILCDPLPARQVEVSECSVLSYEYPLLHARIRCSSGTYIRSLAHDLGHVLRCGGYLESLRRTMVGDWNVKDAIGMEQATWKQVQPMKDVLREFPRFDLSDAQALDIAHGRSVPGDSEGTTIAWHGDIPVAILEPQSAHSNHRLHPKKVF